MRRKFVTMTKQELSLNEVLAVSHFLQGGTKVIRMFNSQCLFISCIMNLPAMLVDRRRRRSIAIEKKTITTVDCRLSIVDSYCYRKRKTKTKTMAIERKRKSKTWSIYSYKEKDLVHFKRKKSIAGGFNTPIYISK
jgi:hypothetical protein